MAESNGASIADLSPILKDWYTDNPVDYAVARNHKLYTLMRKETMVSGKAYIQPLAIGGPQDYADFATAQTNQIPVTNVAFSIPYTQHFTLATVQGIAIAASRNDRGAFLETFKQACDIAMENSVLSDAWSLYRSGTGSIGTINTASFSSASGVVTLLNSSDGLAFLPGQVLTASSADGGGTVRAGVGYVTAVDVITGTVIVSTSQGGAAASPSGWAQGDYLYPQSNFNMQMSGLAGWIPTLLTPSGAANPLRPVAGTPLNFNGVNRGIDPVRTAGVSINVANEDIESALIDLIRGVRSIGKGDPKFTFVNPASFAALDKALQSRRRYDNLVVDANITYEGIMVNGSLVMEDSSCPPKTAYALDMSTWSIASLGTNPTFIDLGDGVPLFRAVSNANSKEARIGGYRNVVCSDPSRNGVAMLPE